MSVINTNVSALYSQNAMKTNSRAMSTAMEQLSTGTRVNSAKDDAAGLAIGQNMTSQIRGLNMAVRNLNDGINMMQTAEGAMVEQSNMLQRMRELAVQSMNGTYDVKQRSYLDAEFQQLKVQIGKIATDTKWNDQTLLDGTTAAFTFQAGASSGQTIDVAINNMGVGDGSTLPIASAAITDVDTATMALSSIETSLQNINEQRSTIGAGINRMEYAVDNLSNISANATQSRSAIMDTDYAVTTTQLAKTQIIQQAATAMLAQANQQPQQVMQLLK
jgi:flagellin